ncbi:hypothetical protein DER46DRAFT_579102 [Fusarium sp. MPI-SDFR-AT-0072]|nr:hypothetical protein DER46DRAFT_579102 [Fusarium sp. MPI-SDFR-AT-0072]
MTHLTECAFALPDYFVRMLHCEATEESVEYSNGIRSYHSRRSYQQVWRDFNGSMAAVVLPYVDSYPKPPYQVVQEDEQAAGYWILEASDDKILDSRDEPANWYGSCDLSQRRPFGSPGSPRSSMSWWLRRGNS